MQTKPLIYGIVGFLIGGLLVSIAAVTFNKPKDETPTENTSMSMQDMTDALKSKTGDDFDKEFIAQMIEHHQGAIDMAKLSDKQAKHQEIKDLSKAIVEAQEKEIAEMKQWQEMWGYSDMPMPESMQH
jgi:uncharacterized protein (DUF305 family)